MCNVPLTRYLQTHTDEYDLKARHSTLRTLTNSFTLRARNNCDRVDGRKGIATLLKRYERVESVE